jgi:23S rRNA (cytidine1920-2'-O)/16S rRNA (cytidine1409-2'-O)-methyltransferase
MADRLDQYLVAQGLVETRTKAQRRIGAGDVTVNGHVVTKVSTPVPDGAEVLVRGSVDYVGRGALKLEAALQQWDISVEGLRVLDIGASTGGFTQVLLNNKAAHVLALDVGHDQIHHSLRSDPRVTVWEGVNARTLTPEWWGEHQGGVVDCVVVDVSFHLTGPDHPARC